MKITIDNYKKAIDEIGVQKLKPEQKEAHEFIKEFSGNFSDISQLKSLMNDAEIKKMLELYFNQLENFTTTKKKATPVAPKKAVRSASSKKQVRYSKKKSTDITTTKKKVSPGNTTKKKVAGSKTKTTQKKVAVPKPEADVKRTVKSKELSLINAYKNWHGKRKNQKAFELMDTKLTKGFADGSLKDYEPVLKDMHKSVKKGLAAFKSQNLSTIEVELSNIEKLKSIVKDASLKLQVNYLGSVGKDEGGSTNQGVVPSHLSKYGFQTADSVPEKPIDTFQLPNQIGLFLGELQPYRLAIAVHGETHSSKTQLVAQIADAFSQIGKTVGLFDLEQGGMISKDTQMAMERNVTPANRQRIMVTGEAQNKLQTIKELADAFDVVIVDSWQKLDEYTSQKFDELRLNYPATTWIVIFQRNAEGKMKGGSASSFDAPIVIETKRPDEADPKKNYARLEKNRGNSETLSKVYQIAQKRTLDITEFQNLNKKDDEK